MVRCIKLLGLNIASSLSFKAQVKSMYKKENVKVAALRRVRKTITPEAMVDICKAYILPHSGYCAPVLAGLSFGISIKLELTNQYAMSKSS